MATFYDRITEEQQAFIARQHLFFVATAHGTGRINCSPKGMDTFRVLGPNRVGYLDLTGSGIETAAHLQHDGRITIMMCSFEQKPNILRLYGRGRFVRPPDTEWDSLMDNFETIRGQRQIIVVDVESTQDSCGFAVPRYQFIEPRDTLVRKRETETDEAIAAKIAANTKSIDGLPVSF